ncbi:MAG: hypothetical protein U1E77_09800 [Inhella sp.]
MSATEPTWTLILQRSVFGWIVGGATLLGSVIGISMLIMSVVEKNSDSWLVGVAGALYYAFFFGAFAAAHGFLLVSVLGLAVLPFRPIRHKPITLLVCAVGLVAALQVLIPIYFNKPFIWG